MWNAETKEESNDTSKQAFEGKVEHNEAVNKLYTQ